jgi:hypothetical protein
VLPGQRTPRLQESVGRLGTGRPLAQAAEAWAFLTGVTGSPATVRRTTEAAGAADVAVQTAAVETIAARLPPAPAGPAVPRLRVEGAMGPWLPQPWAEGKTLALGTVRPPVQAHGEWVVHPGERSSFARLTEAETCGR